MEKFRSRAIEWVNPVWALPVRGIPPERSIAAKNISLFVYFFCMELRFRLHFTNSRKFNNIYWEDLIGYDVTIAR